MFKINTRERDERDDRPTIGLTDDGHTIIKCSKCGKPLVDVWHLQRDAIDSVTGKPFHWKAIAHCCYCGDKSFSVNLYGRFYIAGYGTMKTDDPEQDIPETFPTDIDYSGNLITIKTIKANTNDR
jgi:ribosomal protein L37E